TPFKEKLLVTDLDLGIVVFLLVNKKAQTIDRIALSNTALAKEAVKVSAKPFREISIPLYEEDNVIAAAIKTGEPQITDDWQYLFTPVLSADEARRNQLSASIECSMIVPIKARDGAAMIFSFYQPIANITDDHRKFARDYAKLVQKYLKK